MDDLMYYLKQASELYDALVLYSKKAEYARQGLDATIKELKDKYNLDLYKVESKGKK